MAAKKTRQRNLNSAAALAGILLVVMLIAGMIYSNEKTMRAQIQSYIVKEEALQKSIEAEISREAELKNRQTYVTTDRYIKEVAKEKLGLLSPDEVLLEEKEK